jgi:hypothetical protein
MQQRNPGGLDQSRDHLAVSYGVNSALNKLKGQEEQSWCFQLLQHFVDRYFERW